LFSLWLLGRGGGVLALDLVDALLELLDARAERAGELGSRFAPKRISTITRN